MPKQKQLLSVDRRVSDERESSNKIISNIKGFRLGKKGKMGSLTGRSSKLNVSQKAYRDLKSVHSVAVGVIGVKRIHNFDKSIKKRRKN